jgi:hypothetical protein
MAIAPRNSCPFSLAKLAQHFRLGSVLSTEATPVDNDPSHARPTVWSFETTTGLWVVKDQDDPEMTTMRAPGLRRDRLEDGARLQRKANLACIESVAEAPRALADGSATLVLGPPDDPRMAQVQRFVPSVAWNISDPVFARRCGTNVGNALADLHILSGAPSVRESNDLPPLDSQRFNTPVEWAEAVLQRGANTSSLYSTVILKGVSPRNCFPSNDGRS